jgi:uncharacterized protein YjbJ (UPF0337 family)
VSTVPAGGSAQTGGTIGPDHEAGREILGTPYKKEHTMSGTADEIKGRTKEAVGVLTDDKELQREGKTDQTAAATKSKLDNANDWAKRKIDDIKNKVNKNK